MKTILIILLFVSLGIGSLCPCSTFALKSKDGLIMGKSYDFIFGHGLLTVNKRNVNKIALMHHEKFIKYSTEWKSKYGSVTFNQYGVELPSGGINEAGLAIELMWLLGGKYPELEKRNSITELQWIQYQLDNYANLKEVIKNLNSLQIINTASELHYTVCDAGQNCAVIAPVDGKLKAYTAETLPVTVSTNTVYEKNLEYFKSKNFQSVSDVPLDFNLEEQGVRESENRFCRAAILVEKYNPTNEKETIEYANKILKEVEAKVTTWTKVKHFFGSFLPASYWKIIYNTKEKIVNFSTYDSPDGKHLDLKKLDFSCKTSRKILDLNSPVSGDILDKLQDYSTQANRDLLSKTMIFIEGKIPKQALEFLAIYPEKLLCAE